jgi:hypothetical protein
MNREVLPIWKMKARRLNPSNTNVQFLHKELPALAV